MQSQLSARGGIDLCCAISVAAAIGKRPHRPVIISEMRIGSRMRSPGGVWHAGGSDQWPAKKWLVVREEVLSVKTVTAVTRGQ